MIGAAIALALATTACTTGATPAAAPTEPATQSPATQSAATQSTTTTEAIDPMGVLAAAVAAYADGYEYRVTATVNDQIASVISGRFVAGSSQFTVTSGDATVEYVATSDGRWVRSPGAEWSLLDDAPLQTAPLQALATPRSVEVIAHDGARVVLRATYPALALGTGGDDIVTDLVIEDGLLVEAGYDRIVEGVPASVVTRFAPLEDVTPITAPTVES